MMRALLVLLVLAVPTGCTDRLISRRTRAMIDRELETARLSGFVARFETAATVERDERLAASERPSNVTLLVLHSSEGRLYPAQDLATLLPADKINQQVRAMVAPYLAYNDLDGAARALVRVYSELLRNRAGYRPTRALAPLFPPEPTHFRPNETAHWGIPVALLCAVLGIRMLSRRASAKAQQG